MRLKRKMNTQRSREVDSHVRVLYKYFLGGKPAREHDLASVALYILTPEEREIVIYGWDYKNRPTFGKWLKEKWNALVDQWRISYKR